MRTNDYYYIRQCCETFHKLKDIRSFALQGGYEKFECSEVYRTNNGSEEIKSLIGFIRFKNKGTKVVISKR